MRRGRRRAGSWPGRPPAQGHRRSSPPEAGADAPDHPAPGLHPGAHGRRGRVRQGVLGPPRLGEGARDGLRAALPAVLPGPLRAEGLTVAGDRPTVYTTTWCPYSRSLVNDLRYFGVAFDEVDVDADDEAVKKN